MGRKVADQNFPLRVFLLEMENWTILVINETAFPFFVFPFVLLCFIYSAVKK